jgi:SSS family solute:Na+ symporter
MTRLESGEFMRTVDLVIVVVYVLGCTALGRRLGARSSGLKGYFLGESNIPAWAVMLSIVATETSTATFLSVPGVSYRGDFTYLQLAFGYVIGRLIVATVLLPAYFQRSIFTAYEVLDRRFGGATKTISSLMFLATRTLGDGLRLFLAAKVLDKLSGWGMPAAIAVVGITTIVYTYLGGMKAVIWIDVIQFCIYIAGAIFALFVLTRSLPGGWGRLWEVGGAAGKFRVLDFSFDLTRSFTFWAGLIGGAALNTATHGADQIMVQRYLSARSRRDAAGALIASGFVVAAQFSLFLLIGVGLYVYYHDFPLDPRTGSTIVLAHDDEFVTFILHKLPAGVLGIVIAAIFSAAMGSLSSSLNASASATVNNLYRPFRPATDEAELLKISRGATIFWGAMQMGTALGATRLKDHVVNNALSIAAFTTGIVLGLFLLGVTTKTVRQRDALLGLVIGLATVSAVVFGTKLAWPWYALVGSTTVYAVGAASRLIRGEPAEAASGNEVASRIEEASRVEAASGIEASSRGEQSEAASGIEAAARIEPAGSGE